ncbi:hypothetical protein [uncultured Gammaproteobacteria bacterium]|nr:hypothetical protein [uncultured Gammaproteobacteria bacterium]CAC9598267.1 hypothetical protein [uncultured Gammaproteobacteria bacterium]CAC9997352.1 hypothetical protein [uncultured Gammaproteobacteria bacterium]
MKKTILIVVALFSLNANAVIYLEFEKLEDAAGYVKSGITKCIDARDCMSKVNWAWRTGRAADCARLTMWRKDGDEKAVKIWIRDFRSPYWKAKQEQLIWGYDEED